MDIDALRSFLAFTETGSFTRAAKQINRTQSAFSAQMKKLEDELSVKLFEKHGRNLILTEAGSSLRVEAEKIITLHGDTVTKIKRYQHKQPLRLGCPEDYNDNLLPLIIERLYAAEPTCSIQVFSRPSVTLREWLDEGKIDAAIVTRSPNSEEGYWLCADQGVWISSPDYDIHHQSSIPLALFQKDCKYHAAAIETLSKKKVPYHLLACCDTSSAQRALVAAGLAVGAIGRISVSGKVKIVENLPPLPNVDIVLLSAIDKHPLLEKVDLDNIAAMAFSN